MPGACTACLIGEKPKCLAVPGHDAMCARPGDRTTCIPPTRCSCRGSNFFQVPVTDFFGSVLSVELTTDPYDLVGVEE